MKYNIVRSDVADSQIRSIILYVAEKFGKVVALEKLEHLEKGILALADNPDIGMEPKYLVLKRQGYKVLILEKNLVFYKVNESQKEVVIYAVVDQRQDYLNIIRGL
ncbi:MAG: type II toxin-antitoxin system RelE/ParE family toxin [Lachnospiraceae bacterium]|nr:type II toxin-antitoxin system RelE/ParE family toxin [Lachnospiraceae bacterium]